MPTIEPTSISQDMTFHLVSLLYHSLKCADTCEKHSNHAEQMGETALAAFFYEVAQADKQRAERTKVFLATALKSYAPKDMVEQASKASFPASDPPSHSPDPY